MLLELIWAQNLWWKWCPDPPDLQPVLTGAELEPLTEDGHTAMGTDSPSLGATSLLNAACLHRRSVRHNGVSAPGLQTEDEPQALPRLSTLPGPAADLQDIPPTTDVFSGNGKLDTALASGLPLEEKTTL